MAQRGTARGVRIALLAGVFVAGFVCGSLGRGGADAQMKDLGGALEKAAGQQGGALGSVVQLGSAIVEMQQHVDGLQKNLEALNKVKAALGG